MTIVSFYAIWLCEFKMTIHLGSIRVKMTWGNLLLHVEIRWINVARGRWRKPRSWWPLCYGDQDRVPFLTRNSRLTYVVLVIFHAEHDPFLTELCYLSLCFAFRKFFMPTSGDRDASLLCQFFIYNVNLDFRFLIHRLQRAENHRKSKYSDILSME